MTHDDWRRRAASLPVGLVVGVVLALVGVRTPMAETEAVAPCPWDLSTQASPAAGTRIRFELVSSRRDGATGAPRTEVSDNVANGDRVAYTLSAGTPGKPDLCEIGALAIPDAAQAFYLWQIRAQVLSVSASHTTLHVSWGRSGAGTDPPLVEDDVQTLTLDPGEFRVLDFVRDRTGASPCASVQLQVRADPLSQPGVQPTLTYDVWLIHEGRGRPRVVHQTLAAPSGQPVTVDLAPLAWSVDGRAESSETSSPRVIMKVRGALAATLRADGTLDVSVRAIRSLSWGRADVRGEGRQDFRGALGEVVSLILPDARGRATASPPSSDGSSLAAVRGVAGGSVLDFGTFFGGTRTSLYVRVDRK